jgi:hypothetical protein
MPADKKKRPGHRPEKKASKVKVNSANEKSSRPGPKSFGRERGAQKTGGKSRSG